MCLLWWLWVKASSYLHSDILNRCNRRYPLLLLWVRAVCCICTGLPHPKPLPEMSVILCCSSNCISPYFWSSCAFALVPRNSSDCSLTKKNFFFFFKNFSTFYSKWNPFSQAQLRCCRLILSCLWPWAEPKHYCWSWVTPPSMSRKGTWGWL